MKVKVVAIVTVVLLAAIALPILTQRADAKDDRGSAYAVNAILEKALARIEELVAEEKGTQTYDALKKRLEYAQQLAENARMGLERGAYQQALNDSMRALTVLSSVAAQLKENKDEEVVAAQHSILRVNTFLNGLKNLTDAASAKGFDVSGVKMKLEAVERLVEEARTLSAKKDSLGAGRKVAESKRGLGQIVSALNQAYEKERVKLIERYVNDTLSRIYGVEEARSGFIEQIRDLNSTRRQMQAGDSRQAIKGVNEAMKQIERKLSEDLKRANEELFNLKERVNDLKARGVKVERLEALIQEATDLLTQASAHLEKGDYVAARVKLAQAEAALQRLR